VFFNFIHGVYFKLIMCVSRYTQCVLNLEHSPVRIDDYSVLLVLILKIHIKQFLNVHISLCDTVETVCLGFFF
jgi:hypothetical protein